jgi:mycothione reductase
MEHYDLTIIGSGSGNSIANPDVDPRYGSMRIAMCEDADWYGGTCLNVGCIPTKMFVYASEVAQTIRDSSRFGIDSSIDMIRWPAIRDRIFRDRIDPISMSGEEYRAGLPNTTLYRSHARFGPKQPDGRYLLRTDAGDEFTSDQVVLAAGSRIRIPPAITECGVKYYTSDTVMRLEELPEHMVIVGGGFVAAEFAHVFSALGVRVTIVVRGAGLLTHCDESICHRFTDLARAKWDLRTHENVVGSHQDGERIVLELDDGEEISADVLLVATGRVPNGDQLNAQLAGVEVNGDGLVIVDEYQRTTAQGVWACGDVSSTHQLKHVANYESRIVQHNLLVDWASTSSMRTATMGPVPSAVFTEPQLAMVGLTEAEALDAGYDVLTAVHDYGSAAYGWAMEDTTGVAKILADARTGRILGAHIMGYQSSSIIQPLIQAMSFGQTAMEVARGQYWIHPALPEVIEQALLKLYE